jgi:hypothetical protein
MVKFETELIHALKNATLKAGIIQDCGMRIPTPLRVLNSAELEHGRKIESKGIASPKFPHPVFEITRFFKPERLIEFTKNADVSAVILKETKRVSERAGIQRLTIFHPVLNRQFIITEEINKKLVAMQIDSNVDLISILEEHNSPVSNFKDRLQKSIQQINDSGQYVEPMPTIRMDSDPRLFGDKIEAVISEGIKIINVTYAGIKQNFANYSYLANLALNKKKNVWIHMSEVPRRLFRKIPAMHLLPLFGIDSFALNSKPFPMGLVKRKEVAAKRFDKDTLGFLTLLEHQKLYGDHPNCNCFVEVRNKLSDSLSVFQAAELLSSAITCHEAIASYYELLRFRESILKNQSKSYLSSKPLLIEPIKKLLKIDLAQQELK